MGFSENLKRIRESKKISVDDICKQTGTNDRTFRNYEKGTWPPEDKLKSIAHALNVSLNELIGYRNLKGNEPKPQDYCKQLSLKFDESNQDSYVITAKKSIIPQGKKVVINKSDFVDIKQETKEKAAPFITEIEAAIFMILAYCKQNNDDLKEIAINNISNAVKEMYGESNYTSDIKQALKLRDNIIVQQKKTIERQAAANDSLCKYKDQLQKGILSKAVNDNEAMKELIDENYTLKLYIVNQSILKKMEETGKNTLTEEELDELKKTYPW